MSHYYSMQGGYIPSELDNVVTGADDYVYNNPDTYNNIMYSVNVLIWDRLWLFTNIPATWKVQCSQLLEVCIPVLLLPIIYFITYSFPNN